MMRHFGKKKVKANSASENCEDNLRQHFKLPGERVSNSFSFHTESNDNYPKIEE